MLHTCAWKKSSGNAFFQSDRLRSFTTQALLTTLPGIEVVLSGSTRDQFALFGNFDPFCE